MPSHSSLCCILHVLIHSLGALIVLVCWILVLVKQFTSYALRIWFWNVECIRIYMDNHSTSSIFYYCVWICCAVIWNMSYLFHVFDCRLGLHSCQWVQCHWHCSIYYYSIIKKPANNFLESYYYYCHPIFQLVPFLIASDSFLHIWVVYRGMVSPRVFCVLELEWV